MEKIVKIKLQLDEKNCQIETVKIQRKNQTSI